ncbi:MAG: arsenate reductase ArsC [Negativicutes bacterium]|nr:arsenate reductase ArsC [Negativicutes bacterium]
MHTPKQKVLFLCTHNSARSQMAEGLLRALYGDRFEAFSAGTEPSRVNPYVARAMAEIGIDLSTHRSKHMKDFFGQNIDYVVTVCDNAKEACPFFPGGAQRIHHSFPDPSALKGDDAEIMAGVRKVRDEIKSWIIGQFGDK